VPDGSFPLIARATDDYGVSRLRLGYTTLRTDPVKGDNTKVRQGALPLHGADGSPQAHVSGRWNIGSVRPKPGDTLRYEVAATDNDTLNGPHTGRSLAYNIHVVSLLEMQRRLKEQLDEETRMLAQLRQRQVAARQQLSLARQKPNNAALSG